MYIFSLGLSTDIFKTNQVVGFALGCLLGEVFLHALPEHWTHVIPNLADDSTQFDSRRAHIIYGLQFIAGMVVFFAIEQLARITQSCVDAREQENEEKEKEFQIGVTDGGNIFTNYFHSLKNVHITGILNLIANCSDNFTHGMAIGVSYLSGIRIGMITTFGILLHEIPHEVGDVAILLKSGMTLSQIFFGQVCFLSHLYL